MTKSIIGLIRMFLGIPLGRLAELSGISSRELRRIERVEVTPSSATFCALQRGIQIELSTRLASVARIDTATGPKQAGAES